MRRRWIIGRVKAESVGVQQLRDEIVVLRRQLADATRCTCPVGFGAVRDPRCHVHGHRDPSHTITGPPR